MQLKLAPERLDQRRERALVASLGPLEIDGHASMTPGPSETDRRSVSRHRGVFDVRTIANRKWADEDATLGARKVSSALARVCAACRTCLPSPVYVLQGGNGLTYLHTRLILHY